MDMVTSPRTQGVLNERRFFEIINSAIAKGDVPSWMKVCRRATKEEDLAGVDGFVTISSIKSGEELYDVPFQVKSSQAGVVDQLKKDPIFWKQDLRFFVIHGALPDDYVLEEFIKEIQRVRMHNLRFELIIARTKEVRWTKPKNWVEPAITSRTTWWTRLSNFIRGFFE
jgi:hypothetical protein